VSFKSDTESLLNSNTKQDPRLRFSPTSSSLILNHQQLRMSVESKVDQLIAATRTVVFSNVNTLPSLPPLAPSKSHLPPALTLRTHQRARGRPSKVTGCGRSTFERRRSSP
jgi:hypothetical protein